MSSDSTPNDDESGLKANRRQVIAALGSAGAFGGAAAVGTGEEAPGDLGIGGGPMSSELSHLQIEWSEGPESDLPAASTEGRFFRVTSGGANYSAGDILRDDGSSWSLINLGVQSLNADSLDIGNVETYSELSNFVAAVESGGVAAEIVGNHTVSSPIQPASDTTVVIPAGTTLTAADGSEINLFRPPNASNNVRIIGRGGILDGQRSTMTNDTGSAVYVKDSDDVVVEGLIVRNWAYAGINYDGANNRGRVLNCLVENTNHNGLKFTNSPGSFAANCTFRNTGSESSEPIDIRSGENMHAYDCVAVDFPNQGAIIDGAQGCSVVGGSFTNGKVGVRVDGGATDCVVAPDFIQQMDETGVFVVNGPDNVIDGITFRDMRQDTGAGGQGAVWLGANDNSDNVIRDCKLRQPSGIDASFFLRVAANNSTGVRVYENDVRGQTFTVGAFDADADDLHRRDNDGLDDYVSAAPANPHVGMEYYDDGTNTGSGTRGKRVYDGAAWNDAWTV